VEEVVVENDQLEDSGAEILDDRPPLARRLDAKLVCGQRVRDGVAQQAAREIGYSEVVLDGRDGLLERGRTGHEWRHPVHGDAFGKRAGERVGKTVDVDRLDELQIEILRVALVADTEREPKADLRAG
jgi:hypothetical protein